MKNTLNNTIVNILKNYFKQGYFFAVVWIFTVVFILGGWNEVLIWSCYFLVAAFIKYYYKTLFGQPKFIVQFIVSIISVLVVFTGSYYMSGPDFALLFTGCLVLFYFIGFSKNWNIFKLAKYALNNDYVLLLKFKKRPFLIFSDLSIKQFTANKFRKFILNLNIVKFQKLNEDKIPEVLKFLPDTLVESIDAKYGIYEFNLDRDDSHYIVFGLIDKKNKLELQHAAVSTWKYKDKHLIRNNAVSNFLCNHETLYQHPLIINMAEFSQSVRQFIEKDIFNVKQCPKCDRFVKIFPYIFIDYEIRFFAYIIAENTEIEDYPPELFDEELNILNPPVIKGNEQFYNIFNEIYCLPELDNAEDITVSENQTFKIKIQLVISKYIKGVNYDVNEKYKELFQNPAAIEKIDFYLDNVYKFPLDNYCKCSNSIKESVFCSCGYSFLEELKNSKKFNNKTRIVCPECNKEHIGFICINCGAFISWQKGVDDTILFDLPPIDKKLRELIRNKNWQVLINTGIDLANNENIGLGVRYIIEAYKIKPCTAITKRNYGNIYFISNIIKPARKLFLEAYKYDKNDIDSLYFIAKVNHKLYKKKYIYYRNKIKKAADRGDEKAQLKYIELKIECEGTDFKFFRDKFIELYFSKDKYISFRAKQCLCQCTDIIYDVEFLMKKLEYDKAKKILIELINDKPLNWKPLEKTGNTVKKAFWNYKEFIDYAEDIKTKNIYQKIIWKSISYSKAYYLLYLIELFKNNQTAAHKYFEIAYSMEPDHPVLIEEKAKFLVKTELENDDYREIFNNCNLEQINN